MKQKSRKNVKKTRKQKKIRNQKIYYMRGCSNKTCKKNIFSSLGNSSCSKCPPDCSCGPNCDCPHPCPGKCYLNNKKPMCSNCGPNCHCGPNCKCPPKCRGNCYLNQTKKHSGGRGCGCNGCPIAPFSWKEMNQYGGEYFLKTNAPLDYKPILGVGQNGGTPAPITSSAAAATSFYKGGPPLPGPFIGSAWGTNPSQWPGEDGIGGNRNYLTSYDTKQNNIIANDPQLQAVPDVGYKTLFGSNLKGGKMKKGKNMKAGSMFVQDLVSLGQDLSFNMNSAYNALNGYKAPVSPLPYQDQLTGKMNLNKVLV
jgi:hypothetical protein